MTRRLTLPSGHATVVDDEDHDWLNEHTWKKTGGGYVGTNCVVDGRRLTVLMHRLIAGPSRGQVVDHINGDKLDNRRANLRICTPKQNLRNRATPVHNKVGLKGVSVQRGRYRAIIMVDGRQRALGYYDDALRAGRAYDLGAIEHFGQFARLNFSPDRDWLFPHESGSAWPPAAGAGQ